ncbi:hypothetical protein [Ferrovibrio terrae]|uniref:hypothetical protein n=1 Tax=Ferrovibrio terrae TaxID=2594003 RepID=UPI00313779DF
MSYWQDFISPALVWLDANHLGDAAGIIGLLITALAFWKAKRAQEAAAEAANAVRSSMRLFDSISQLSIAIASLEEIKRHYYSESWMLVSDRCASLRRLLVVTRSSNPHLTDSQKTVIQNAVSNLAEIEEKIESRSGKAGFKISKLPRIISDNLDLLLEVLIELKTAASGENNGN